MGTGTGCELPVPEDADDAKWADAGVRAPLLDDEPDDALVVAAEDADPTGTACRCTPTIFPAAA